MRTKVLESWEFGDPVDVVARREAKERGAATAKRRQIEQRKDQRRIKALVKQVMQKEMAIDDFLK